GRSREGYEAAARGDAVPWAAHRRRTPPSCHSRGYCALRSNNLLLGCETGIVESGVVPVQSLLGAIARAYQRPRDALEEAARESTLAVAIELRGRDVALDGQMVDRRPQILAESYDVDTCRAQVGQRLLDLRIRLTETEHQAALGQH